MRILKDSELFTPEGIAKIEEKYSAKYVCETCLKNSCGWVNSQATIFYQADESLVPKGGSQWFAIYVDWESRVMIANAISAVEEPIKGIIAANGDIIYSRYRHDYRISPDGTAMVDGGRDYLRTGPIGIGSAELRIVKGELMIASYTLYPKEKGEG